MTGAEKMFAVTNANPAADWQSGQRIFFDALRLDLAAKLAAQTIIQKGVDGVMVDIIARPPPRHLEYDQKSGAVVEMTQGCAQGGRMAHHDRPNLAHFDIQPP